MGGSSGDAAGALVAHPSDDAQPWAGWRGEAMSAVSERRPRSAHPVRLRTTWDDRFYLLSYLHAQQGLSDTAIAQAMGISPVTFARWCQNREALAWSIEEGRKHKNDHQSGTDRTMSYIYKHLSPEHQQMWDKLSLWYKAPDGATRAAELFRDKSLQVRQHFYVHALIHFNFKQGDAMRMLGLNYSTVKRWMNDPAFGDLVEEIQYWKKNLFEDALTDLVVAKNTLAVVFANRTLNRDRGYGITAKIEHGGTINHQHLHAAVDLDRLSRHLEVDVLQKVLEAVQKCRLDKEKEEQLPAADIAPLALEAELVEDDDDE